METWNRKSTTTTTTTTVSKLLVAETTEATKEMEEEEEEEEGKEGEEGKEEEITSMALDVETGDTDDCRKNKKKKNMGFAETDQDPVILLLRDSSKEKPKEKGAIDPTHNYNHKHMRLQPNTDTQSRQICPSEVKIRGIVCTLERFFVQVFHQSLINLLQNYVKFSPTTL